MCIGFEFFGFETKYFRVELVSLDRVVDENAGECDLHAYSFAGEMLRHVLVALVKRDGYVE